jgi:lysophospholipase L1-like esterase
MSNHDCFQKPMILFQGTFVLFGSSTTQFSFQKGGWGQLLINHYHVKADILNRGFSGYNTRMILPLVDSIFSSKIENVQLVTVWLGSNDSSISAQGVPVEEFKQNLSKIVDKIKQLQPKCKILMITPQVLLL